MGRWGGYVCSRTVDGRVGFRGLDPHLGGGLKRQTPELAEHIPAPLLRVVDQVPAPHRVDRLGDLVWSKAWRI
jgi:hypothetical protein